MVKTKTGLIILSGIATLFAIGAKYFFGASTSGDLLFWLFIIAIGSLIVAISIK